MSGKVEEVARAIREASPSAGRGDSDLRSQMLSEAVCLDLARAAIEAMREPNAVMIKAMDDHAGTIAPQYAYEAAIDAALSEEGR